MLNSGSLVAALFTVLGDCFVYFPKLLSLLYPFMLLAGMFVAFIRWNGGIVLGTYT
jgi:DIE2/ALG10 family